MNWNRRDFLRGASMATAASCASVGAWDTEIDAQSAKPRVNTTPYVQFDVSGLYAFELYQAGMQKKLRTLLINGVEAGLDPLMAEHAPLMMTEWTNFDDTKVGEEYYPAPHPVRFGDKKMAVWSLAGSAVWVAYANPGGYDTDPASDLAFVSRYINGRVPPEIKDMKDEDWEDIHWFADLREIVGWDPKVPLPTEPRKDEIIRAEILLTRGAAFGRVPTFPCERERTFFFECCGGKTTPRAFATQMAVKHPSSGDYLKLMIAPRTAVDEPRPVYIKTPGGTTTHITIVNTPLGHPVMTDHFKAFYTIIPAGGKTPALKVDDTLNCAGIGTPVSTSVRHAEKPYNPDPVPPYDSCVPSMIAKDPKA